MANPTRDARPGRSPTAAVNLALLTVVLLSIVAAPALDAWYTSTIALAKISVRSSAGVVAQVWRDGARQVRLARVLSGVDVVALDLAAAKRVGPRLGATSTSDAIDGHVAQLATPGDEILTSDPDDVRRLVEDRITGVAIVAV